jgi:hypothetical protein
MVNSSMVNSNLSSPVHFGLAGTFSPEDIQELLGAMSGEQLRSQAEAESTTSSAVENGTSDEVDVDVGKEEDEVDVGKDDISIPDEAKVQARSERKRSREKQRRSDVNSKFADLTLLLRQIESEEAEEDTMMARLAFNPTNRVDLVARTIMHLERLRDSNKKRVVEVESLQQQLDQAKKAGEDTAAKLKETMFNQPPQNKQVSRGASAIETNYHLGLFMLCYVMLCYVIWEVCY